MSLSPGDILQKLQEIRNWQPNDRFDLFKKFQKNSHNQTTQSDYETIDGISPFDDTKSPSRTVEDIDKKPIITPRKEFTELLEDKLKECCIVDRQPTMIINRPKRPFLRKGSGLRRFRLTPDDFRIAPKAANRQKSQNRRNIDAKTPLKAPDFVMNQPKAAWTTIVENPTRNNELSLPSEQTLYEELLEKELKIFEMVEQKVENGSFCSTSSSILRIFALSPQKNQKIEKSVQFNDQIVDYQPDNNPNIDINGLLRHLNEKIQEKSKETQSSPTLTDDESNCSSCFSISSTDLETTISNKTRDIGVNTCNLIDNNDKIIKLERINDELRSKIDDLIREHQLEKIELITQMNDEKEKMKLRNQNTTKERELIKNLKQELNDLKETIKLKDTKNGTTQARLRNQIKQLEKDKNNLNSEIEKLSKENARLKALEKLNQPKSRKDTKILNQINDNIHKLIENNKKSDNSKDNNDSLMDFTNFKINDCIEKQYENVFKEQKQVNQTLNDSNKTTNRIETILDDGSKQIKYSNGNLKIISPDGNTVIMKYYNGDIKQTSLIDGVIKYYYKDKNIWQITDSEYVELIEYPEGHKEKRYPDGRCEIIYPDGILQKIYQTGEQQFQYPDGSMLTIDKNGDKILNLPNGQKEIETKDHKRREYPDGTIKFIYNNGTQETRYSNGRIRKRDVDGVLIFDNFA